MEDCAKMGSQSRRKKKSTRKRPRFVEEERNAKRRIGNHNQQQADLEGQPNIMDTQFENQDTQMQDGIDVGEEGESSNRQNLPSHIPTTLPSSLHSRIDVGEKIADRTIRDHTSKLYQEYFSPKSLLAQAQLLTCLLRRKEMRPILSLLGVNQNDNTKVLDIMVSNVRSSYDLIGSKTRTKDHRATRRSIMTAIVSKMTSNKRLVTATSKVLNISRRTLARIISTREQLETINPNQCWAIVCRCPRNDKVSNEWHDIVVNFWTENSRVSSNRRDVLTHRISRGVREEHYEYRVSNTMKLCYELI